jgi:hypothetical protein
LIKENPEPSKSELELKDLDLFQLTLDESTEK